jgi:hypothetical protein
MQIDETIGSLFYSCIDGKNNTFSYECMRLGMRSIINAQTLLPIMESLEVLFLQSNEQIQSVGIFTCHPLGHMAGEIAVQQGIAFADVVRTCDRRCDFGCTHGAFVAAMLTQPSFLDNVDGLCSEFEDSDVSRDLSSCAHAVGHGLDEVLSQDIVRALSYCDKMQGEGARHACGQGAIMDNLVGLPDRPRTTVVTQEEVMDFCGGLPGVYKKECFDSAGAYASKISKDEKEAKTFCDTVPSESKAPCIYSLGSVVYFLFRHDTKAMSDYCMSFEPGVQMSCLQGALDTSVGESDPFSYGRSVCEQLAADTRRQCFSFLGDRMRWAQGSVQADTACSALSPADTQACRAPYEHP